MAKESKVQYVRTNSELVKTMRSRTLGEIIDISTATIETIDEYHGRETAELLEQVGSEVTNVATDVIEVCKRESGLGATAQIYLLAILATNLSVSILSTVDRAQFSLDLDAHQEGGGAE